MKIALRAENSLDLKQSVEVLERAFLTKPQVDCPVTHTFGPGVCIREVRLPAGSIVIGHHQNFEHVNIFVKGRVSMRNDDGTYTELSAPMTFVGKPGRKIGYIHDDVIWLNVWKTDEKDVEKIESQFLKKSDTFHESVAARDMCAQLQSGIDRKDFEKACADLMVTPEQVWKVASNESDMTDLPNGSYKIKVADSKIHGRGLFVTGEVKAGEVIAPARIKGKRTIAGRFTNHSITPNAQMIRVFDQDCNDIYLTAIRDISGCRGGLDGEEITIDYREAYALTMAIAALSGKVE